MKRRQTVGIAKGNGNGQITGFAVTAAGKQTAEPSQRMSQGQSRCQNICCLPDLKFFDYTKPDRRHRSPKKSAEKDQSAVPNLKNLYIIIFIGLQINDHIEHPGPDNGRDQDGKKQIRNGLVGNTVKPGISFGKPDGGNKPQGQKKTVGI